MASKRTTGRTRARTTAARRTAKPATVRRARTPASKRAASAPTRKKRAPVRRKKAAPAVRTKRAVVPSPRELPPREWERGTALVQMFAATGYIANSRPQSMLIVSEPGTGKTELLERFRPNKTLSYHSDLTVRQVYPILRNARRGYITHIVCTELQKLFQRKSSIAENCLGTIVQAMEEGVDVVGVGQDSENFGGARCGMIGAITNGTLRKRRELLGEMGFLSRAAVFPWDLPPEEERDIMARISRSDFSDIEPIKLPLADGKVAVELPVAMSARVEEYVWQRQRGRALRVFNRLRALTQATALLDGRDVVRDDDVTWVLAFDGYWAKMIEG